MFEYVIQYVHAILMHKIQFKKRAILGISSDKWRCKGNCVIRITTQFYIIRLQ